MKGTVTSFLLHVLTSRLAISSFSKVTYNVFLYESAYEDMPTRESEQTQRNHKIVEIGTKLQTNNSYLVLHTQCTQYRYTNDCDYAMVNTNVMHTHTPANCCCGIASTDQHGAYGLRQHQWSVQSMALLRSASSPYSSPSACPWQ